MKLQNYSRNRKSNRLHQPEALDSKLCTAFPDSRTVFARHNDSRAAVPDSTSFAFFPQFLQWAGAGKVPQNGPR